MVLQHRLERLTRRTVSLDRVDRREVSLAAVGLLPDGTTFQASIVDLSYDGCKIETSLALLPGLELHISAMNGGRPSEAIVRWYKDGSAGLKFKVEEFQRPPIPRSHNRVELSTQVALRQPGRQHYLARVFDVTAAGCKVEFVERPRPGDRLWVKFEGLEAIEATAQWVTGFYGGLQFVRPFHPAVFELLVSRLQQ